MGYNRFQWWTKGCPTKPLSNRAHLWDRIQNGDYDQSHLYQELQQEKERCKQLFDQGYNSYKGQDESGKIQQGWDFSRMSRVKCLKLQEEALKDEHKILNKLIVDWGQWFRVDMKSILESIAPMDVQELYQYMNENYSPKPSQPIPDFSTW